MACNRMYYLNELDLNLQHPGPRAGPRAWTLKAGAIINCHTASNFNTCQCYGHCYIVAPARWPWLQRRWRRGLEGLESQAASARTSMVPCTNVNGARTSMVTCLPVWRSAWRMPFGTPRAPLGSSLPEHDEIPIPLWYTGTCQTPKAGNVKWRTES